jgi:hypothetical protein
MQLCDAMHTTCAFAAALRVRGCHDIICDWDSA